MTAQTQERLLANHLEQQKIIVNPSLSLFLFITPLFSFQLESRCIEIKSSFNTLKGRLVTVHERGILAFFRSIVDFMCLDGHGFAKGGRAKAMKANIVEIGPPPSDAKNPLKERNVELQ